MNFDLLCLLMRKCLRGDSYLGREEVKTKATPSPPFSTKMLCSIKFIFHFRTVYFPTSAHEFQPLFRDYQQSVKNKHVFTVFEKQCLPHSVSCLPNVPIMISQTPCFPPHLAGQTEYTKSDSESQESVSIKF